MGQALYSIISGLSFLVVFILYIRMVTGVERSYKRDLYTNVMVAVMVYLFADMCWGIVYGEFLPLPVIVQKWIYAVYYGSSAVMSYHWFIYAESQQNSIFIRNIVLKRIASVPMIMIMVISVISVWNGWFFFIDENGMYHRGDGYFLQIGVTYGYIIFSAIKTTFHMLKTKDFKEQNTYLTMLSYFIFPMVFGILQIINQNSPYLCIGIALSILQTYLFIVNFEQERDVSSSKIHSLSRLFKSSFYLDLQTGSLEVLGEAKQDSLFLFSEYMTSKDSELFTESIKYYAKKYVHEQDREMFYRMCSVDYMEKHLNKENLFYFFNYRQIADGIERWYRVHIMVAAFAPNNHIHKVVLAVMDVDKQVKNEIHQKSALEEALVEAKKANKAKTAFLSNVSHDIRTPMNAIVGFSNLAKSHIEDRELVSNYLEKILSAGNHLLSLINDVLDMSRIESGKVRIDENEYNLLEIIEEVKMMMLPQAQEKELEFFVDCEIQNHYVYCDKLRLNQIFINLLGNAVKFTTQGGKIDWKIRQIPIVQSGFGAYIFSIKDNGIGIAPEFLDKIFDAFEREKNGKTNGIQGTGLGLSITKNMVELMGGRISVESKVGEGTEFIVKVVFLLQDVDEEIMHQKKLQNKAQEVHLKAQEKELQKELFRGKRILLVEDNSFNREIARMFLLEEGFVIEEAVDGKIALEKVKTTVKPYDLILMDIQMPVMDGYEATQQIRRLSNSMLANIPIVAMTANAFEEEKKKALECGMNGHIAKPINVTVLFETIKQMLQ